MTRGTARLPAPRSRPLVIYHAGCAFCRRWVARLARWDRAGRLEFLPLQDDRAPAVTGLPRDALEQAAHVVMPSGAILSGAAAFRAVCRFLPGGYLPSLLLRLPGMLPIADRAYRWIARRWGPVGRHAGGR